MSQADEMHCVEVVEVVTHYLERALSETDRLRLEAHLEYCEGCEAYVEQMRQTVAALRRLDVDSRPADLDGVLAAFRERHPG